MEGGCQPPFKAHSGAIAVNPRGLGTESPSKTTKQYDGCWMITATRWIINIVVAGSIAFGQQKSVPPVLTVCEVLGDVARYADRAVIVLGRIESSVGLIDHYEFLSEDQCEQPLITHGHLWSNKIQIWAGWDPGMPKPPRAKPQLEPPTLAAKLLIVRRTTKLGFHDEPYFKKDGNSVVYAGTTPKPNEWSAVYGRIMKNPDLNEHCDVEDCRGHNVPLMIIAEPYNVHRLAEDGRLLPER
jgi:hypothetical protein